MPIALHDAARTSPALRAKIPTRLDIRLCGKRDSLTPAMSVFRDYFRNVVQSPALFRPNGHSAS